MPIGQITGESLNIRGRPSGRNQTGYKGKSRSKSRGDKWWKKVKCYSCQEFGHTNRFCPKKNKKNKEPEESKGNVGVAQDGYDNAEVLIVTTIEGDKRWILDSRCLSHMTPNKDWFETFEEVHGV